MAFEAAARPATTVLVVDARPIVRRGIRLELEASGTITVIGEATSILGAVGLATTLHPQVAVISIEPEPSTGIEACRRVAEANDAAVVLLGWCDWDAYLACAFSAGAAALLADQAAPDRLIGCVRAAGRGERAFAPEEVRRALEWKAAVAVPLGRLTGREVQVLRLVVSGATTGQISRHLVVSQKTIEYHVASCLLKLGLDSRRDAMAWATRTHALAPQVAEQVLCAAPLRGHARLHRQTQNERGN